MTTPHIKCATLSSRCSFLSLLKRFCKTTEKENERNPWKYINTKHHRPIGRSCTPLRGKLALKKKKITTTSFRMVIQFSIFIKNYTQIFVWIIQWKKQQQNREWIAKADSRRFVLEISIFQSRYGDDRISEWIFCVRFILRHRWPMVSSRAT